MTPYTFDCSQHGEFVVYQPMAETTRHHDCTTCGTESPKVIKASFHFTYGRADFHGPTLGERQRQQLVDAPNAVPTGTRWI